MSRQNKWEWRRAAEDERLSVRWMEVRVEAGVIGGGGGGP